MKLIYEGEVLDLCPIENGLIFCYCEEKTETQMTVAFKMLAFDSGRLTNVAKNIYQLSKFGPDYKPFCLQTDSYITCKVITFPGEQKLVLEDDGTVKIFDTDASLIYTGKLLYSGEVPKGIALYEDKIWCAYENKNALVRYNVNNMREELRIGGGQDTPFKGPVDIFVGKKGAYVCNSRSNSMLNINFSTFELNIFKEFDMPVKKYLSTGSYEFIVTQNGLYMI